MKISVYGVYESFNKQTVAHSSNKEKHLAQC